MENRTHRTNSPAKDLASQPIAKSTSFSFRPAIVMACDEGYAMPLATALRSILENNRTGRSSEIVVLTSQFSDVMKERVLRSLPDRSASVQWVLIDVKLFERFSTRPRISKMTFARLLVPHLLPQGVSRALYLDADVLVLDDLADLWHVDLEGGVLGAVVDMDSQMHSERLGFQQTLSMAANEGNLVTTDYFNAGLLLIDVERWRENEISEKALDYMKHNPTTPLADQDALNIACNGRWKALDPRWNYQAHYNTRLCEKAPEDRPGVVHFVMDIKPWDPGARNPNAGFYDDFRNRTCFARTKRQKLTDAVKSNLSPFKRMLKRYLSRRPGLHITQRQQS